MQIESFNQAIDFWIAELDNYRFESLIIKPGPTSWSLGQVYAHLINETGWFVQQAVHCLYNFENLREEMKPEAKEMFRQNQLPAIKIQGEPDSIAKITQPVSIQQLREGLLALRINMNDAWRKIEMKHPPGKSMHPGLGYFNAAEWVQFAGMHLRHHVHQKQNIDAFLESIA